MFLGDLHQEPEAETNVYFFVLSYKHHGRKCASDLIQYFEILNNNFQGNGSSQIAGEVQYLDKTI